jgi:hypothetical protein
MNQTHTFALMPPSSSPGSSRRDWLHQAKAIELTFAKTKRILHTLNSIFERQLSITEEKTSQLMSHEPEKAKTIICRLGISSERLYWRHDKREE